MTWTRFRHPQVREGGLEKQAGSNPGTALHVVMGPYISPGEQGPQLMRGNFGLQGAAAWGDCLGVCGDAGEEPAEPGLESELVVLAVQQSRGAEGGEVREVARAGEAL